MTTGNIGKIKASRVNNVPNVESYVGESGILFYNYANGVIRMSDGITPGGVPIPYNIASNVTIGGIKVGPGVDVSSEGVLYIDTANLALSFGNFTANNNVLSIVNVNEDMYLRSSGTANINLVGGVNFYKPNGFPPTTEPFFRAKNDGQIRILVPVEDPLEGGIEIIGSATGTYLTPGLPGAMLHLTGNPNISARFYMDSIGEYGSLVGRRYNGNVGSPTQVLAGQDVFRFNATAATNAGMGNVAMAQMQFRALENQTTTAQGSSINFIVTPIGSSAASRVEVANISVANGVSATKFTTTGNVSAGNLSATGNITAGNVTSYVTLSGGTTTKAPLVFTAGNVLTTPTPGSVMYDGQVFSATPQSQQRGVIKTPQTYVLNTDYALTNQTAVQTLFGVSAAVSTNTRYGYTINAIIYKSANNITMSYALDGNASITRHTYQTTTTASSTLASLSTASVLKNAITTGFNTPVVVTAALNGSGFYSLQVTGTINVTTGGTWNPLIAFSGLPGAGSYVAGGSSVEIYPLGQGDTTISVGNWT